MTILGPEGLVAAVKLTLETNLDLILTEVDNQYAEAVNIQKIAEWRIDDPLQRGTLPQITPCGWVVVPSLQLDEFGQNYQYGGSDCVIWLLLSDQDSQVLRQKIYRTTIAVWKCIRNGSIARNISWNIIDTPTVDFGALLTGRDNLFFGDARLVIRMYTREDESAS